jgi:hypothetical protein
MRTLVCVAFLFLFIAVGRVQAQHGTAEGGYFPPAYAGDTWTGEVSAVDDVSREITLVYKGKSKNETFVGVLQQGYTIKRKDGSTEAVKPSMIRIGARMRVYYMAKDRKVNGRKEKFYEIFGFDLLPPEGSRP